MDRVQVQIQFKKFIWLCPICQLEEFEDRPMEGGASYEHTCANGHHFNQSGPNMKEYNGVINYPYDKYPTILKEDIDKEKQDKCDAWLYEVKNPKPYVEPTREDLERMLADKQVEVTQLQAEIAAKEAIIGD